MLQGNMYFSLTPVLVLLTGFCPSLLRAAPSGHHCHQREHPAESGPARPGTRGVPSGKDNGIYPALSFPRSFLQFFESADKQIQ